jgi:hypothetical protein
MFGHDHDRLRTACYSPPDIFMRCWVPDDWYYVLSADGSTPYVDYHDSRGTIITPVSADAPLDGFYELWTTLDSQKSTLRVRF